MRTTLIFLLIGIFSIPLCQAQSPGNKEMAIWKETEAEKTERMRWWTEDRFGMFIHWGLYSQLARHEWIKKYEAIPDEEYRKYFELFNPDLFDPAEWAAKAKAAGMKYAVITSKHHEGVLPVQLGIYRLQRDQHALRERYHQGVDRRVPCRRIKSRVLLLADRLESPALHD